jgi:outer membrane protein assembly factor BamB
LNVSGSTLFAGSQSGWFTAYDLTNRRERWRANTGSSDKAVGAAVEGSIAYVVLSNGHLAAFSDEQRKQLWDYGEFNAFANKPVAAGDRIFLSGPKGFWALSR